MAVTIFNHRNNATQTKLNNLLHRSSKTFKGRHKKHKSTQS